MLSTPTSISEKYISFSTKAETLSSLINKLNSATILPLYYFTVSEWTRDRNTIFSEIQKRHWHDQKLVIRSSAIGEDSNEQSLAGKFKSIIDVSGEPHIHKAINEVIASFDNSNSDHQILIQPYLGDAAMSGVVFGRDPNTDGPYIVINYNDVTSNTNAVTSGQSNSKCYITHQSTKPINNKYFACLYDLVFELSQLFGTDFLDIEFAFNKNNILYLLQVRPLIKQRDNQLSLDLHQKTIARIAHRVSLGMKPHPYLYGTRTVYGVMPDWNPAEIIGIRPKALALSLYKELITDAVWAYQRDNYGYSNLRSFPLLVDFEGLPYIDVRVSFNSFLPKNLPNDLAEQLVNYYIDRLINNPMLHDKVEFDIIFSSYVLNLQERLSILANYNFSKEDRDILSASLIQLTNQIIHNQDGLWKKDLKKIEELKKRQEYLFSSDLDPIIKMYWIIEDCKRYGTLPFAGLARAGFIAIQLLKSFINAGIINEQEYTNFLTSVNSVSSDMKTDFANLSKEFFLIKYGHLRPGTYDILSPRYDKEPDLYFDWTKKNSGDNTSQHLPFSLSIPQLRKIQEHIEKDKLDISVLELLEFIKTAIESREYSKFIFTRSVSMLLEVIADYASQFNISREECAYINIKDIIMLYSSSVNPEDILRKSILMGKKHHQYASSIILPPVISSASDVWNFELPESQPNFITQKNVTASVAFTDTKNSMLRNKIVLIPSADPGYDWIFSHDIAGLITQYGGVNSHMAIRAGELGIPAIIGSGEIKYNEWSQAKQLYIDCLNKQVKLLCS